MIALTRLNGTSLWLNPLLIESIESTPDSIVTLTNGHKYVLRESAEDIAQSITHFLNDVGLIGKVHEQKDDRN